MKESMLKALGVGLRWDTRKVEVREIAGLYPARPAASQWQRMDIAEPGSDERTWAGWWQVRGDFVITLACYSRQPADLQSTLLIEKWIH
jgi:hypothetical protein